MSHILESIIQNYPYSDHQTIKACDGTIVSVLEMNPKLEKMYRVLRELLS